MSRHLSICTCSVCEMAARAGRRCALVLRWHPIVTTDAGRRCVRAHERPRVYETRRHKGIGAVASKATRAQPRVDRTRHRVRARTMTIYTLIGDGSRHVRLGMASHTLRTRVAQRERECIRMHKTFRRCEALLVMAASAVFAKHGLQVRRLSRCSRFVRMARDTGFACRLLFARVVPATSEGTCDEDGEPPKTHGREWHHPGALPTVECTQIAEKARQHSGARDGHTTTCSRRTQRRYLEQLTTHELVGSLFVVW